MNCRNWEERIALWVGGDLAPSEARELEQHLADCSGCQVFASGIKQSMEALRDAHAEPIAEAHFAAVRARALERLETHGRSRWKWIWLGGAVAAAVFGLVMVVAPRPAIEPPAVAVAHPAPPRNPTLSPPGTKTSPGAPRNLPPLVARRSHGGGRRKPIVGPPEKPEPLLVKLVTDDPDVVIYWIADGRAN